MIARVNGVDIHESEIAYAEEEIGSNIPNMPPEQKRDYLITYLTDVMLLSQAADQQKLADRPDVKRRLAFDRNRLLMEALLQGVGHGRGLGRGRAQGLRRRGQADEQRAGGARAPHPGARPRRKPRRSSPN